MIPPATPAPIITSIERPSLLDVLASLVDVLPLSVDVLVSSVGVADFVDGSPILHAPWTSSVSISKSQEESICNRFP